MSETKTFPKSRLCVVDMYPLFEKGVREAVAFCQKNNIATNTADGKRILVTFCIKAIELGYKEISSPFPKVLSIRSKIPNQNLSNFIDNYFSYVMDKVPFPYCGKYDLSSPDLETAAEKCLEHTKTKRSYDKLLTALKAKRA